MGDKKGVQCKCGEFTPFNAWVYAHWDLVSEFTCPKCDRRYTIHQGESTLEKLEQNEDTK